MLKWTSTCLVIALLSLTGEGLRAQEGPGQTFARIASYAESFRSLNERYDQQAALKARLIAERDDARRRLIASENDLAQIQSESTIQSMRLSESRLYSELAQLDVNTQLSAPTTAQLSVKSKNIRTSMAAQQAATVKRLNIGEQVKQLNLAGQLTVERRQKILLQLQQVAQQAQEWLATERSIYDQYLGLADVAGVRSEFQWKAALRELGKAKPDNLGAKVALAITLLRLEQSSEADKLLDELINLPTIATPTALAVRADSAARHGDAALAHRLLNQSMKVGQAEPLIRWLHAQTLMILEEPRRAGIEWETMLRSGKYEIAAHRGLALTSCACSAKWPDDERYRKKALEEAKLASSLSGETDWSCQIAMALATAVNGDLPRAAEIAEEAATLAIAEKKAICSDIADKMKAGKIPAWHF